MKCLYKNIRTSYDGSNIVQHTGRNSDGSVCVSGESGGIVEPPPTPPPAPPEPSTILLNNITNGGSTDMVQNQIITFKDSGADSNYGNSERYNYTFSIPQNTSFELTFNDFRLEHSGFAMYDRLGLIVDGQNANIPWMQSSATIAPPWSSSYGGSSWNSTRSKPGWLVPLDFARARSLGWDEQPTILSNVTTLEFVFFSDSSVPDRGWSINIKAI